MNHIISVQFLVPGSRRNTESNSIVELRLADDCLQLISDPTLVRRRQEIICNRKRKLILNNGLDIFGRLSDESHDSLGFFGKKSPSHSPSIWRYGRISFSNWARSSGGTALRMMHPPASIMAGTMSSSLAVSASKTRTCGRGRDRSSSSFLIFVEGVRGGLSRAVILTERSLRIRIGDWGLRKTYVLD